MSLSTAVNLEQAAEQASADSAVISLADFIEQFGDGLLDAVRKQNPPVYDGTAHPARDAVLDALKRKPFAAQREVVQAVTRLMLDHGDPAAIINSEMGTARR